MTTTNYKATAPIRAHALAMHKTTYATATAAHRGTKPQNACAAFCFAELGPPVISEVYGHTATSASLVITWRPRAITKGQPQPTGRLKRSLMN